MSINSNAIVVDQSQTSTVSPEMPSFFLVKTDKDTKYEFDLETISDNSIAENFLKKKIIEFTISISDSSTDYNKFWEVVLYPENKPGLLINKEFEAKNEFVLIINSADLSDESLREQFRENILDWLEKFKIFALESLWQSYKENKLSPSLLSEILELVGIANLNYLDSVRIDILRYIFTNENLRIRHGAIEGISNLNSRIAIPFLEEIMRQEDNMVLKKIISSYVEQLKSI